jgi:propionyl-CoA synthetase
MKPTHHEEYARWQADPEGVWAEAAEAIHWHRRWERVLDDSAQPIYRWFAGAEVNTCYNCLDRHVDHGRADQTALIYDSPITGALKTFTYRELRDVTARFAGALRSIGIERGDRVILYMPMIPEAAIAMLACARIGAVHSVVFGGFAAKELATRIDDARPRAIVAASCGIEPGRVIDYLPLINEAIALAEFKPDNCVVLQREQSSAILQPGRDLDWDMLITEANSVDCVPVAATDPLYILYTSGTTGVPKGVVRDNGGHMVALQWSMQNIYGVSPGEVYWAASDVGWVVGHSYIVYAPLLNGCTTVMFEGKPVGTPDAGVFWRVAADQRVNILFTAPTALRAIKREDPEGKWTSHYDLSSFRALFLAGERADPDTIQWAERYLGIPVIDHWWQTETGWPIAANCLGFRELPIKYGSCTKPVPGYEVRALDERRVEVPLGQTGAIAIRLPLPPGCLPTLWNNDEGFVESYLDAFPGFYQTGDAGYIDEDGYLFIMSRTDDIINTAGHRLSTGAIEEVLSGHPDVAECAVIGAEDAVKGQIPLGFVILKAGVSRSHEEIVAELVIRVRETIGPVASFKQAAVVTRLPKTRSGKILRGAMRRIADGKDCPTPATIDDPSILEEIADTLKSIGYMG